ncbi:uncharacterized protein TRIADDRAFT_59414 [Trichoplax adhaerens]|uniref:Rho-GAP domain-containing protein n=1 Tax=Trichoplax adhaerens TaxID=10228 RepID=B3S504_TRIAD|nr:hypothetical protein TRIADDRAFT_59414 [Trichoplax adhaerens]EDV22182.1 hypothetical protein TRIADDRAFT_59414 [Trichoplax adhaerens]|eukprot:XP_002115337.1 hypothetical protein TRIADDRAFT_59414 [Trichoplax adhaerens]
MPRFAKGKAVNGGKSQIKQNNQTQNANHYSDNGVVNDKNSDDIMELTYDVNSFSNAMTRLKESLKNRKSNNDDSIEEWVGEVVSILKRITEKNTDLVSNSEIMTSTRTLLLKVNDYSINECTEKEVIEAAVHLELALTDGITDLIDDQSENNDLESDSKESNTNDSQIDISPGSIDYLQSKAAGTRDRVHSKDPQAIDHLLQKTDNSMEISLQYAKSWLKYAKEISTYVEKRSRLELDYAKSLSKLAQQTRQAITEEDIEYSNVVQQLYNNQLNLKFTEPLNTRRNEHDAARKILKDSWMKLDKKYQDAKNNIKKAKNNYKARVQEHVKFKSSTKGEIITGKKKREEDEIKHRIEDADVTLKAATVEAEGIQENLQKSKDKFLVELRQLILQCDVTLKAVTANYFQMRNTALSPFPVQYQTLSDNAKMYEPGTQFIEFLSHRPENAEVEPPSATADMDRYNFSSRRQEEEDGLSTDPLNRSYDSSKSLASAFQEDLDGSVKHKNASTDLEPDEAYKHRGRRDGGQVARALAIELFSSPGPFANMALSTPAKTHVLRKLKSPSRCQECDSFLYFSGAECERCGLTCHKKCLEKLSISCGSKHHRKLSTFGVDIHDHLVATNQIGVPIIVSVCINEIDKRGLKTQGIYRISGVKSQVEKLCQFFESMDSSKDMKIDLSKTPVHHIASVLRLYLRQLPEPLLTFRFYEPFIELAKESFKMPEEELIKEAIRLVEKLPESNYKTCQKIVAHLKRIHDNYEDNKMSAANLGIVFGPTILGRRIYVDEEIDTLTFFNSQTEDAKEGYKDMSFQARMVELLILNQAKIFRYTQEDTETNDEQDENAALENSTTVSSDDPSDPSHLTTSGNKSSDDLSATSKSNDSQPLPQNENVDYPDNTEDISSDDDSEYDSDFITVHHNQTKNEDQLKRKNSIKHEIKNSNDLDYVPPAIYHESNDDFMQEEDELNNSQISFSTGSLKSDEYMEFLSTESAQDVMTKSSSHNIIREVTTRKAHRSASDIGRYNDKRLARLDFNPPLTLPINPIPFTYPPKPVTPSSQSITLNKSVSVPDREPNYAKPSIAGDHFDPVYEYRNESLNDPNHAYNKPHHSPSESNLTANLRQRQYEQLSQQQTTNVNTFRSSKLRHRHSLDHQRAGIYREHLRERGYSTTNSEFAATNSGDENPRVKYV